MKIFALILLLAFTNSVSAQKRADSVINKPIAIGTKATSVGSMEGNAKVVYVENIFIGTLIINCSGTCEGVPAFLNPQVASGNSFNVTISNVSFNGQGQSPSLPTSLFGTNVYASVSSSIPGTAYTISNDSYSNVAPSGLVEANYALGYKNSSLREDSRLAVSSLVFSPISNCAGMLNGTNFNCAQQATLTLQGSTADQNVVSFLTTANNVSIGLASTSCDVTKIVTSNYGTDNCAMGNTFGTTDGVAHTGLLLTSAVNGATGFTGALCMEGQTAIAMNTSTICPLNNPGVLTVSSFPTQITTTQSPTAWATAISLVDATPTSLTGLSNQISFYNTAATITTSMVPTGAIGLTSQTFYDPTKTTLAIENSPTTVIGQANQINYDPTKITTTTDFINSGSWTLKGLQAAGSVHY